MATYEFPITLFGEGHEEKEAWLDAVEKLAASMDLITKSTNTKAGEYRMATYEFKVTLTGEGDDENDAWIDACEAFEQSPGLPPDDFEIDYESDNQVDWSDEMALGDSTNGEFE